MATKPHRRIRSSALAVAATATCLLAASPALASTGGVNFDAHNNAAAGDPANLFNATFTGARNVGVGPTVMPSLTFGADNVATGYQALNAVTQGFDNIGTGSFALFSNTTGIDNVAAAPTRSPRTRPASITSPPVPARCRPAGPATATSPSATTRWRPTRPATTTPPSAPSCSRTTGPAARTSPLARAAGSNNETGSNNIDLGSDGKPPTSRRRLGSGPSAIRSAPSLPGSAGRRSSARSSS
jgi:hypothetical protein